MTGAPGGSVRAEVGQRAVAHPVGLTGAAIADETAVHVEVAGEPVCLARSNGRLFALRDVCSHADVALSEGDVEDGAVECWLHGSRFDLATGQPSGLPANRPVATYTVTTTADDQVLVALVPPDAAPDDGDFASPRPAGPATTPDLPHPPMTETP